MTSWNVTDSPQADNPFGPEQAIPAMPSPRARWWSTYRSRAVSRSNSEVTGLGLRADDEAGPMPVHRCYRES
ncbi:hypothetical protein [Nonomuraea sp. NPDC049141]|uniref:hypothetical protein n=1 Tax=unclassified Nonomuraea TaxID=2593643 RepID=UPI0033F509FE